MLDPHIYDKRFRENHSGSTHEIKQIWEQHQEILRRLVLGESPSRISEDLNVSIYTISTVRNSPIARERLAELSGERDEEVTDISKRIKDFAPIALDYLENIILGKVEGASVSLTARTAEAYLAKAGHGGILKIARASGIVTKDDIEKLKERAREAAANQQALEVDYNNV